MTRRFSKILVANRGEIACRIFRTAQELGYGTVAVYSDADAGALHVAAADEAVRIGPPAPGLSYLNTDAILDAARRTGADAIHPGYGFLSENAEFAQACLDAGIVFIGPPPPAIAAMGNKAAAKRLMIEAGVPCVPGYEGEPQDDATLTAEAVKIGFPVLLKAAAGGGGRGMRRVSSEPELAEALQGARSEAKNAFGSDELIIEKLVQNARHVEIQVFADESGNCIHLGERDCSVQRRHQKIIEESPCPVMTPELRAEMGYAAVRAAKAVEYVNAGTVEFLLDEDGRFYFLEMNTRLQVEHPVTEMVTGWDLVAAQVAVAQGQELPEQPDPHDFAGHAIEVRLYAEDPARDFMPHTGAVLAWQPPGGTDGPVRVDHGLRTGDTITPYYDPMIAKIIASGESREDALAQLAAALDRTVVFGVKTNLELLQRIAQDERFAAGDFTTHFLADSDVLERAKPEPDPARQLLAAAILIERSSASVSPLLKGWRSTGPAVTPVRLKWKDTVFPLTVHMTGSTYRLQEGDREYALQAIEFVEDALVWESDGRRRRAAFAIDGNDLYVHCNGRIDHFTDATYAPAQTRGGANGVLKAPMAGQIVRVNVVEGASVEADEVLVVLEAMKMENQIVAPVAGTVSGLSIKVGDQVDANQILLTVNPNEKSET